MDDLSTPEAFSDQPINRIHKVNDELLAVVRPDGRQWKLRVSDLWSHPDFEGIKDLTILGVLERGSEDVLGRYGVIKNPTVAGAMGDFSLRHRY